MIDIQGRCFIAATVLLVAVSSLARAADMPRFDAVTIEPNIGQVCYALTLADVDGDKKTDIVAVSENRVLWYHNPDWKPRVIIEDQVEKDHVCIAPLDIDGDGQVDFALGAGWLNGKNLGTVYWLSRGKSLDEKWQVHAIGRESWTHRIRWGDLYGTGKPQLIVSPLNKTVGNGVRLLAFEIPANPKTDAWKSTVIDDALDGMHNHWMADVDGDGKVDCLTSSAEGVFLLRLGANKQITKTQIGEGVPGSRTPQKTGAGEIKLGKLKGSRPFIATVEPMHGNNIVVYTAPGNAASSGMWTRHILDDTLKRGHAVSTADIDGDGSDELVIGHSDKGTGDPTGPGVFVYKAADDTGSKWTKHPIDNGGIATEDLVVGDLNGDGKPDIVAGGRATHNVKLYMNLGAK